jgi:hypothetical protein
VNADVASRNDQPSKKRELCHTLGRCKPQL